MTCSSMLPFESAVLPRTAGFFFFFFFFFFDFFFWLLFLSLSWKKCQSVFTQTPARVVRPLHGQVVKGVRIECGKFGVRSTAESEQLHT